MLILQHMTSPRDSSFYVVLHLSERALRDLRRSEGTTYQFLALQTASDGVVENICLEMKAKLNRVRLQADMYSIHLQL